MEMPRNERSPENPQILVVGQDGMALGGGGDDDSRESPVTDMVDQPAKVMRIGSMIKQLLEEVRAAPLDEASRVRLKEIHTRSIKELEEGLAPELVDELERLSLPFTDDAIPSEAELRIAQAQLVGWLEGLFHGIQTALFAQQMAARAQFEEMRRALPPGVGGHEGEETARGRPYGRPVPLGPVFKFPPAWRRHARSPTALRAWEVPPLSARSSGRCPHAAARPALRADDANLTTGPSLYPSPDLWGSGPAADRPAAGPRSMNDRSAQGRIARRHVQFDHRHVVRIGVRVRGGELVHDRVLAVRVVGDLA